MFGKRWRVAYNQWWLILLDAASITLVFYLAVFLRFEGKVPASYLSLLLYIVPISLTLSVVVFYVFNLYRSIWYYASMWELMRIFFAVTASAILLKLVLILTGLVFSNSIQIICWLLNLYVIGGTRFSLRIYRDYRRGHESVSRNSPNAKKVIIVGAGSAGVMIAKEMLRKEQNYYKPVAFIDDDRKKIGQTLLGLYVVGTREKIKKAYLHYKADQIIIAVPSASRSDLRELYNICREVTDQIKIFTGIYEFVDGRITKQIRDIQVEDLLGREPMEVNLEEMASYLKGETALVTGAGGSIGSELCRQIVYFGVKRLIMLGRGETSIYEIEQEFKLNYPQVDIIPVIADVRDEERINFVFATYKPTVIFHAAAHKHVPLMEASPDEAVKNNIFGTRIVAEAADKIGAKSFVLISTDKAVNPTSVMGVTKRIAEMAVQSIAVKSKTKFCAVRFGNVLGSRGSVIPLFRRQIAAGGPVTITDPDMVRYFMTIPEAVQLTIQAGAMGSNGEIFVLDMGEPVKILDLATELIKMSGLRPGIDIEIKFTGIRPGEKLYEEVLTMEEGTQLTRHERIYITHANGIHQDFRFNLEQLKNAVQSKDYEAIIRVMGLIVGNYRPDKKWDKRTV